MFNLRLLLPISCLSLATLTACSSSDDQAECRAAVCGLPKVAASINLKGEAGSDAGNRLVHICQRDVCRDFTLELEPSSVVNGRYWSSNEARTDLITGYVNWAENEYDGAVDARLVGHILIVEPEPVETWSFRVTTEDGTVLLDETREATYRHWSNKCCGEGDVADIE